MKKPTQSGVVHLGLLLLVLVVAVIAFVGYKLEQNRGEDNTPTASVSTAQAAAGQIPTINTKADLNSAQTTLNSQNIDGDLNPDSYNSDVSSLQ